MKIEDEMINYMIRELAHLLMEEQPTLTLEEAMDQVFNSTTYQKVMDTTNGLYSQSPRYVYSILQHELRTGRIG
jgi:hypothetical protein